MKDNEKIVGQVFKRNRKRNLLTQEAVAYSCNIDRKTVSDIERGSYRPNLDVFCKLAWTFLMEPDELLREIQMEVDLKKVIKDYNEE